MSNRRAFFVWISLNIESERSFRFAFPIPLLLCLGFSDFLEDIAFFIPASRNWKSHAKMPPASIKQILLAAAAFFREIALNTEPYELLDVDVWDGQKRVRFKCLLK